MLLLRGAQAFALLTLTACIEPQLIPCGDKVCAPDSVCIVAGQCASKEAVSACDGRPDDAPCMTTLFDGTCAGGACVAAHCGDGLVAGAEQCDGPVRGVDCVEFGFDLGVPACNDRCDLDLIAGCTRFGWRRISSAAVTRAWTDGGDRLALLRASDRAIEMHVGSDVYTNDAIQWSGLTGNASTAVAWSTYDMAEFQAGATGWTLTTPPDDFVQGLVIADDGTQFATIDNGSCRVFRKPVGGSWTLLLTTTGVGCTSPALTAGGVLVGFNDHTVRKWAGTWQTLFDAGGEMMTLLDSQGAIYAALYPGGLRRWKDGVLSSDLTAQRVNLLVSSGNYVYLNDGATSFVRVDGDLLERFDAPITGTLFTDAAGDLYVANNGIYKYSGMQWGKHTSFEGVNSDLAVLTDGTVAASQPGWIGFRNNADDWSLAQPQIVPVSITGRSSTDTYLTDGSELDLYDGVTFTTVAVSPEFVGITDLWSTAAGEPSLYAVGENSTILARSGTTWTQHTAPEAGCSLRGLNGDPASLYVVGDCGGTGVVWKHGSGAAWSEVYRGGGPLASIALTSDGELVAAGPTGGARTQGGVWTAEPEAQGISISATTANDVFVGGGPGDVVHWDGTTWSRLAVMGATMPRVLATPHAVYVVGTSQSVLLR